MSALNEEGVMAVRSAACDRLLASRVDLKLKVLLWLRVCFMLTVEVLAVRRTRR